MYRRAPFHNAGKGQKRYLKKKSQKTGQNFRFLYRFCNPKRKSISKKMRTQKRYAKVLRLLLLVGHTCLLSPSECILLSGPPPAAAAAALADSVPLLILLSCPRKDEEELDRREWRRRRLLKGNIIDFFSEFLGKVK